MCLLLRYLGPNTANMHIVADLYAEVVGVVAQSRYVNMFILLVCLCVHTHEMFVYQQGVILSVDITIFTLFFVNVLRSSPIGYKSIFENPLILFATFHKECLAIT